MDANLSRISSVAFRNRYAFRCAARLMLRKSIECASQAVDPMAQISLERRVPFAGTLNADEMKRMNAIEGLTKNRSKKRKERNGWPTAFFSLSLALRGMRIN